MALRIFSIFGSASLILCFITYFILRKRLKLELFGRRRLIALLVFIALGAVSSPILYRAAIAPVDYPPGFALQFTQYFLMGWLATTFIVFAVTELLQRFISLLGRIFDRALNRPFDPSKRIFFTEGFAKGLVGGTSLLSLGGLLEAEAGPQVVPVEIKLKTLPRSFDGLTLAQISDVHIGPLLHKSFVERVVNQVMALKPDVILISGDLIDGSVEQLREQVEPLRKLQAKEGVYFVTGNHEYYSGADAWMDYLSTMGFHVFRNSNVIFKRTGAAGDEHLMLAGVLDYQAERYSNTIRTDPFAAAKSDIPVACKILMAHNPQSITLAAEAGFDLQVSGHTHAGQFYPFVWLAKAYLKHFEGHYQINEKMQLYVNRGTGFWGPPNRLGKMSEITHYTLRSV